MGGGLALRRLVAAGIVAVLLGGCAGTGGTAGTAKAPAGDEAAQYLLFLRATEGVAPNEQVTLPPADRWPDVLARCRTGVPGLLRLADRLGQLQAQIAASGDKPVRVDAATTDAALYWGLALSGNGQSGMTDADRGIVFAFLRALPAAGSVTLPPADHGELILRAVATGCARVAADARKVPALIGRLTDSPKTAQTVPAGDATMLAAAYEFGGGEEATGRAIEKIVDMGGMAACIRRLSEAGALKPFTAPVPGKMAVLTWRLPDQTTENGRRVLTQPSLQYFPNTDKQTLYYELTLRKVGDGKWEFASGTQVKDGERTAVRRVGVGK